MAPQVSVRFLQLSDVHLGASLAGTRLGYSDEKARQRERELLDAFAAAFRLVESERLDGVLLPGDLFNGEEVDDALAAEAFAIMGAIAPRPVFLAPGNHDPLSPEGPYGAARWRLLAGGQGPPPNLVLFREEIFRAVPWPGRPDVTVAGAAYLRPTPVRDRRLARPLVAPGGLDPGRLRLALLHGSRDDNAFVPPGKATLPFSAAELAAQPFDYTAVGHYHASAPILHPQTRAVIGAYAGMPAFLGLDEEGEKHVLVVETTLTREPERRCAVRVERRGVDPRRLHRLAVDLSGRLDLEQALAALAQAFDGCAPPVAAADVVAATLHGRLAPDLDRRQVTEAATAWLAERCFHAVVFGGALEPELDIRPYLERDARTLEARFARELQAEIERRPEGREREIARAALSYGLEALVHGRIRRRWEPDPGAPAEGKSGGGAAGSAGGSPGPAGGPEQGGGA